MPPRVLGGYWDGKIPPLFPPFSTKFGVEVNDAKAAAEVVEAVEATAEGKRWYDSCIGRLLVMPEKK